MNLLSTKRKKTLHKCFFIPGIFTFTKAVIFNYFESTLLKLLFNGDQEKRKTVDFESLHCLTMLKPEKLRFNIIIQSCVNCNTYVSVIKIFNINAKT